MSLLFFVGQGIVHKDCTVEFLALRVLTAWHFPKTSAAGHLVSHITIEGYSNDIIITLLDHEMTSQNQIRTSQILVHTAFIKGRLLHLHAFSMRQPMFIFHEHIHSTWNLHCHNTIFVASSS